MYAFRAKSPFGSWVYRIVANAAYQKIRGRQAQRREVSLDEVLPHFDEQGRLVASTADWSARLDDPAIQVELREVLTQAINELPPDSRTMLVLRDIEGLSNVEVAETFDVSVPLVKTRVHRARLSLRKRLGDVMTTPDAIAKATA